MNQEFEKLCTEIELEYPNCTPMYGKENGETTLTVYMPLNDANEPPMGLTDDLISFITQEGYTAETALDGQAVIAQK